MKSETSPATPPFTLRASVAETVFHLRRLLAASARATMIGNQGGKRGLVRALFDLTAHTQAIAQTAAKTLEDLAATDQNLRACLIPASMRPRAASWTEHAHPESPPNATR